VKHHDGAPNAALTIEQSRKDRLWVSIVTGYQRAVEVERAAFAPGWLSKMPEAYLKGLEEADAARAKKAAEMAVPAKSGNVQAKSGKKAAETAVDLNVDPKLRGEFQTIEGSLLAIGQRLSKRRFVHVRRHPEVMENLQLLFASYCPDDL